MNEITSSWYLIEQWVDLAVAISSLITYLAHQGSTPSNFSSCYLSGHLGYMTGPQFLLHNLLSHQDTILSNNTSWYLSEKWVYLAVLSSSHLLVTCDRFHRLHGTNSDIRSPIRSIFVFQLVVRGKVYARMSPEQKAQLIEVLQSLG